ncbi:mRNA cap guanine-N7 methyltransferase 1 [Galdieria sulphuraria]|nr:mRNA cap guanine-N7 methyltransferase 1 [Galdieria sulphuraria]
METQDVVAKHYDELASEDRATRKSSKILSLRNLNNWVKSVLIALHTRPGYSVLDLACGKGGDLQKWQSQQITQYVGCDISKESLKTAQQRYQQLKKCTFTAQFLCGDCFSCRLSRYLEPDRNFHIVSCQFSMHYAFSCEEKVRRLLENVTERLVAGGFFIGTIPDSNVLVRKLRASSGLEFGNEFYRVVFDDSSSKTFTKPFGIRYHFYLESSVLDIPEYLVVMPVFEKLAKGYGLELQLVMNFHEFITMYLSAGSPFISLFHRMNILQDGGLSPEFWDTAYLYTVFAMKKQGASPWLVIVMMDDEELDSERITFVDKEWNEMIPKRIKLQK